MRSQGIKNAKEKGEREERKKQFCCETCNKEAEKKIKGRCVGGGEGEKMVELNSEVEEIIRR